MSEKWVRQKNRPSVCAGDEKDGREMRNTKYLDANGKHPPVIVYAKRLDGTYYVISAVAETKAKKIHLISAYIGPQTEIGVPEFDSGTPVKDPRMFDAEAPNFTPEAAYASSSTDSIRDSGEKSNTHVRQGDGSFVLLNLREYKKRLSI